MKIKMWKIPAGYILLKSAKGLIPFEIKRIGYIKSDRFNEDECWNLCNWIHWTDNKPKNLYSDIESASDDIIFYNPENKKYYLAMPMGWHIDDSLEKIIDFIKTKS